VATYVALDLETTGLDPAGDAIIEVGAVKFGPAGVESTFASLVNPRRPVPYRIQMLTGIAAEELADAPPWEAVAVRLQEFLADRPIVGQNVVGFDLRFLAAVGIRHSPTIFDTHELAILLLPLLGAYSLAALTRHFAIPMPNHHRALADAEASRELFLALRSLAASLPPAVLAEAARLAGASRWPGRTFFAEILDETPAAGPAPAVAPRAPAPQPLVPNARRQPIEPSEVVALLRALRTRPDVLPEFEERPEQQAMTQAVVEAFNEDGQLIVEAGTGIGKSLAYLLPAACYARRNNARVVISTATINLQDQLTTKDIPAVQGLLAGSSPDQQPLAAAQLKGKRNYLCLRRHLAARHSPALSDDEARFLLRILLWLAQTETGDRAELRLSRNEETIWHRLSAQNEDCLGSACPFVADGSCFLVRARRRAEAAHLVVVNHALLLSDVAVAGRLIPPYDHLILDEAHHLEEQATRQLGFEGREADLTAYLDRLHRRARAAGGGLTAAVRQSVRGLATPLGPAAHISGLAAALGEAADRARTRLREFAEAARAFIRQHSDESGDYEKRLLLSTGIRAQPDWTAVETAWENLALTLSASEDLLARLHTALSDAEGLGLLGYEGLLGETAILLQAAQQLRSGMSATIQRHDPSAIQWLAEGGPAGVGVGSAPLDVAPLLQERLYADKRSIVLTSATLATRGSFRYIRQRLGLEDTRELLLGSPFDYQRAALILLPANLPEPNHRDYPPALQQALVELCRASQGRALALFTSHASLRAAHAAIRGPLGEQGIAVLGQGIDGTPRQLLEALKRNAKTVLLGTASFWEGVDVVGEALSLLILARLPFTVPSEPIFAARSAQFEDPFNEYALPQAVLRFKQGFGRLIRSKTDRGVVVVLDRRIKSKTYGRAFLESLPPCQVEEAPLDELPQRVVDWIEGKGKRET
jgi:DNA polymerase-3 subunit epsilon/ATP-dependent DNA helicase DinG